MSTSKSAWTAFERIVATDWGSFRVPLSGINSRHNAGDVIMPKDLDALIECKYRANHAHHTLFRDARADAEKNHVNPLHVFLYTRVKRERGYLVTMDAAFFKQLLEVPGVRELLRKEATPSDSAESKNTGS